LTQSFKGVSKYIEGSRVPFGNETTTIIGGYTPSVQEDIPSNLNPRTLSDSSYVVNSTMRRSSNGSRERVKSIGSRGRRSIRTMEKERQKFD
jgi:hypothetical protein